MFDKLSHLAGKVAGGSLPADAEPKIRQFLNEHWPAISSAISSQMGTAALDALRDEKRVTQVAKIAYGFLPGMVRIVVSEQAFTGYLHQNRIKVVDWVSLLAANKA